jgi:DNA-binding transcriptional ArsR family regulator
MIAIVMVRALARSSRKPTREDIAPERAGVLAEILRAVAHPLRLRIIAALCHEDIHVTALAVRLGAKQAIVSQQLRSLRMLRLVDGRRENGLVRYHLVEPRLRDLVACLSGCRSGERAR